VVRWILLAAVVGTLCTAAPASANVLVNGIPKRPVCGDALSPGIFAQPGTKGSRKVRMWAIDDRSGHVWWRKTATATTHFRYWSLPSGMDGQCHPTTIVYETLADHNKSRFHVRFRPEAG
jgi:hypothetical protein